MSGNKILITGATGYIGGTVLDYLVKSTEPSLRDLSFGLLIRKESQAEKLRETYGERVHIIMWNGLDDVDLILETASKYDIVINTGSGFNPAGARTFVDGLARRLGGDNPIPWMLNIAGCTNLADRPLTDKAYPDREWDDADAEAVFEFLKSEDAKSPYFQRTAEVGVLTASEKTGVPVVSINVPCIFGEGTGLFNRQGLAIPMIMRYVVKHGYGYKLNDTANFDWVHIEDLAELYVLFVRNILEREDRGVGYLPSGKKGIIFPAVGRVLRTEIMQRCLDAAFEDGVLPREDTPKEKEIRLVGLQEIADEAMGGITQFAEVAMAGHKAMKGTMAKKLLGWNPTRLEDAWRKDFMDELIALKEGRRGVTLESCVGGAK